MHNRIYNHTCRVCHRIFRAAEKQRVYCSRQCTYIGQRHPFGWTTDTPCDATLRWRARQLVIRSGRAMTCESCGASKADVHHKNRNRADNRPANIQMLCRRCHSRHHGQSETPNHRKLNVGQVRDIREDRQNGAHPMELSIYYGVSVGQIYRILKRQGWKHVI